MDVVLARNFGTMVAARPPDIVTVPLESVAGRVRTVPLDFDLIGAAKALGMGFGDQP